MIILWLTRRGRERGHEHSAEKDQNHAIFTVVRQRRRCVLAYGYSSSRQIPRRRGINVVHGSSRAEISYGEQAGIRDFRALLIDYWALHIAASATSSSARGSNLA